MISINKITTVAGTLFLASCVTPYGETPIATNFSSSEQQKLQAASHWDAIGTDLSKKLQRSLNGKISTDQPVFISSNEQTVFNEVLISSLVTSLLQDGYKVSTTNTANATAINLETKVIKFSQDRLQSQTIGYPSLIATGLWAIAESSSVTAAGAVSAGALGLDAYSYFNSKKASGSTPQSEIVVNLTAVQDNHYIAATKGIYYAVDSDASLYKSASNGTTTSFQVKGGN